METNNLEKIEYDFNKSFEEQEFEIQQFFEKTLNSFLGERMVMPLEDRLFVAKNGKLNSEVVKEFDNSNLEILFDIWCRPKSILIKDITFVGSNVENVSISVERKYIEQSVTWRLDSRTIIVNKNS